VSSLTIWMLVWSGVQWRIWVASSCFGALSLSSSNWTVPWIAEIFSFVCAMMSSTDGVSVASVSSGRLLMVPYVARIVSSVIVVVAFWLTLVALRRAISSLSWFLSRALAVSSTSGTVERRSVFN